MIISDLFQFIINISGINEGFLIRFTHDKHTQYANILDDTGTIYHFLTQFIPRCCIQKLQLWYLCCVCDAIETVLRPKETK